MNRALTHSIKGLLQVNRQHTQPQTKTEPSTSQQPIQLNTDHTQTKKGNQPLFASNTQQLCTHTTTNKAINPPNSTIENTKHVLLSTVQLKIKDCHDNWHAAKALLDSASEINFITNNLANRLCLPIIPCNVTAVGIGEETRPCQQSINATISSCLNDYSTDVNLLLVDTITVPLPHMKLATSNWNIPKNCKLADPTFHIPSTIDLLLGTELFFSLMKQGFVKLGPCLPDLKNTVFGWIVTGSYITDKVSMPITKVNLKVTDISFQLSNFWKIEEVSHQQKTTPEDLYCESLYKNTTTKDPSGRYIVNLPINEEKISLLGNSHNIALKRFHQLESKFRKNSTLKELYKNFISEYVTLGHARFVDDYNAKSTNQIDIQNPIVYLPHHAVIKPLNVSTKLRVVFDGSAATDTGVSLNNILYEGPNIYPEIIDILMRFRLYKFVFTTDIVKMFRGVLINEKQRDLQRILWRNSESEPVKCLQLQTITYGTKSAPYLAYRTLQHLAETQSHKWPLASEPIKLQTFMDDICYGQNNEYKLQQVILQLTEMLQSAGFSLHKWSTNIPHFFKDFHLEFSNQENVGILGLKWNINKDWFNIPIEVTHPKKLTKRYTFSFIAKTFDPLGFLSPCTVSGKIFIQEVWKEKLDWDEPLTPPLLIKWNSIFDSWSQLSDINIPRYLFTEIPNECTLIGFADSSTKAYGGCIYMLASYPNMEPTCNLIISKNKLAPIPSKTIPKLELCAALLLSVLLVRTLKTFQPVLDIKEYYLFTDSSIVYYWLQSPYKKWNAFVSNRLTQIIENTEVSRWNHVVTKDNPADLLTRGIHPQELKKSALWWHGPQWLRLPRSQWPQSKFLDPESHVLHSEVIMEKSVNTATAKGKNYSNMWDDVFNRFSSFTKLQRTIAFCYRIFYNFANKNDRRIGPLLVDELQKSHHFIIKCVQHNNFSKEVNELKSVDSTTDTTKLFTFKSSALRKLSPYLDSDGLLRVGGRIKHANVQFNQKHPIILPCKHHITTLIIRKLHLTLFHSGIQNTLSNLRLNYWPINGRLEVRKVIHNCVICIRYRAESCQQKMSELPHPRVNLERPFLHVGVDFTGAVSIKCSTQRRSTYTKGYICLFICLATKAIHLELVNDLTTQSFILALKRLISRRGLCNTIYSDNAKNFHGAHNELNALYKMFKNKDSYSEIIDFTSQKCIKWCFTVPLASHMGGIYESAIKLCKNLLKRQLGNLKMHYEQLNTILIQIEGILNSRPLCALSDMPNDLTCLTPGHFLIGNSIVDVPEPRLLDVQDNRLNKYQLICKLKQQFWNQWSKQYLCELQNRAKWYNANKNIEVSDLVIIKEDNLPPSYWCLARVLKVYRNTSDNLVRSVLLKTANGEYHRPISKLVLLPLNK
ncbi:hypothetical protein MSG28_000632 [Choristoneura fumiferana]|uniref:Uncharacterized protein n=1 Tax=Choristoneura fumiferana TaxID=7141 RepID=A0ACC0K1R5_CHOFU|nr:hypothetical protein MSG28_000632 [Choristoneura fumiferana]